MSGENTKNHGGKRLGAGRKSAYGSTVEETTVVRIPISQKSVVIDYVAAYAKRSRLRDLAENLNTVGQPIQATIDYPPLELPLYTSKVPAGFPSPADDHIEDRIDPTRYLVDQVNSTFYVTIQGESMIEAGLLPGDKAVIDRDREAVLGDIVLVALDGEFTIKTLSKQRNGRPKLLPANSSGQYKPILIQEEMDFVVWGVVTGSFRRFK